jgi:hypothetical protein
MSDIRANVVSSLKEHLQTLNQNVAANAGNAEAQIAAYQSTNNIFQGLGEGLALAGAEDATQPIEVAMNHIETQIAAARAQADLDALLA